MSNYDNDLRRMKRRDLVDIIDRYQQNEKELREENEALRSTLSEKRTKLQEAGSVAEAALSLNGVFEAAQAAADHYLAEVTAIHDDTQRQAQELLASARLQAVALVTQAEQECAEKLSRTEQDCAKKLEETEQECAEKREKTEQDCRLMKDEIIELIKAHDSLRPLLVGLQ